MELWVGCTWCTYMMAVNYWPSDKVFGVTLDHWAATVPLVLAISHSGSAVFWVLLKVKGIFSEVAEWVTTLNAYPFWPSSLWSELPIPFDCVSSPRAESRHSPLPILSDHCLPSRAKDSILCCLDTSCSLQIGQIESILMNLKRPR